MSGINEVTWAEFVAVVVEREDLKRDLAIAETALEAERQWRLTSLPALLAAEERANRAETRVAELEAVITRELTDEVEKPHMKVDAELRQFPELRPPRIPSAAAVRAAFHQSTTEERP